MLFRLRFMGPPTNCVLSGEMRLRGREGRSDVPVDDLVEQCSRHCAAGQQDAVTTPEIKSRSQFTRGDHAQ